MTLENIGLVYEHLNELQQARSYYEKASAIYRHTLPSTHSDIVQIEQSMLRILNQLK